MVILAIIDKDGKESIVGMAQFFIDENTHTEEVAFVVREDQQNQDIGASVQPAARNQMKEVMNA